MCVCVCVNLACDLLLWWTMLQGMSYLESRGIVHRDLAARNVLGLFRVCFSLAIHPCSGLCGDCIRQKLHLLSTLHTILHVAYSALQFLSVWQIFCMIPPLNTSTVLGVR